MKIRSKNKILLFFIVSAVFNMAANFTHPVTPTIFTNLGLGDYMFGYALAAMLLVNFALSPFWGKINSYISSKTTLLICGVGYGVGQILFALSTQEWHFILVRMFAGAFTGGAFVSLLTYVINKSENDSQRSANLTTTATLQAVSAAFGYFIGGMIGAVNPYLSVWVQGVLLIICGVLFFIVCDSDATMDKSKLKVKVLIKEANPLSSFIGIKPILNFSLVLLFLMCIFQNISAIGFDQSFNYYVRDVFLFPSSYNGIIKGVIGVVTLIANSTICMWILKKTNVRKMNIVIFFVCFLNMTLAILFPQMISFIIFSVILFAFNAISLPVLQDILANEAKGHDSNLVMGFYNAMKSFGGIIGSFASGALYSFGAMFPFVLVALSFALAGVTAWIFYKKHSKNANI